MRHLIATLIVGILIGMALVGAVWIDTSRQVDAVQEELNRELYALRIDLSVVEEDLTQAQEDNVQDRDATRALIACLRIIDTDAYAFDGGMSQCLDDWYEANAEGDF